MARVDHRESHKAVQLSTSAVLFLGTPHQGGSGVELAKVFTRALSAITYTNSNLLKRLTPNSEWLFDLQDRYNSVSGDFETICFYELHEMPVLGIGRVLVVPKHSAVMFASRNVENVPLAADHAAIAKYTGLLDPNYRRLGDRLRAVSERAAVKVQVNWRTWDHLRNLRHDKAMEHATSTAQQAAMDMISQEFKLGRGFRSVRNPNFIGREAILQLTDATLREASQTTSLSLAVMYGAGGIGKTQLAIEYAYRYRSRYTSIFWIDGSRADTVTSSLRSSLERLETHYRTYALTYKPSYEFIQRGLKRVMDPKVSESTVVRDAFYDWLSYEENDSWLLIIDNVDDLESFEFRSILPLTSHGSILVASRRSDLAVNWNAIEVHAMDQPEAFSLLQRVGKRRLEEGTEGLSSQYCLTSSNANRWQNGPAGKHSSRL